MNGPVFHARSSRTLSAGVAFWCGTQSLLPPVFLLHNESQVRPRCHHAFSLSIATLSWMFCLSSASDFTKTCLGGSMTKNAWLKMRSTWGQMTNEDLPIRMWTQPKTWKANPAINAWHLWDQQWTVHCQCKARDDLFPISCGRPQPWWLFFACPTTIHNRKSKAPRNNSQSKKRSLTDCQREQQDEPEEEERNKP